MNKLDRLALIGYPTGQMAGVTGLPREVMVDTTRRTLRVHDGETPGGVETARADLANAAVVADGGSQVRPVAQKLGERLSVFDITGVVADGVADDRTALALFFATTTRRPGPIYVPESAKVLLGSSLTIPQGWTVVGPGGHGGLQDAATKSYYDLGGQLRLGAATITLGERAGLRGLLIIRAGLTQPVPSAAVAATIPGQMNGTAVEFGGDDATVLDCMILGFGLGIDTRGRARPGIRHVGIDAHSGLHVPGGFDIGRIASVHAWPYLTAYTPGVGAGSEAAAAPLRRTGYGFRVSNDVSGPADWFSLVDCFSYGHVQGYVLHNVSNVTLIRCQADYTSPDTGILGGFFITGTSAYVSLLNCTGIGQGVDTITIDTVGNSHGHATVSVTGGRFGGGIRVKNGRGLIVGNEIFTNTKGVIVEAGGGGTLIEGNVFEDITDPLDIAASVLGTVEIWGNVFIRCADELGNMVAVADRRGLAVGRGGQVALRSVFSGGVYGDVAGIRGHLVDGTLANAAGALVLQSRRMGVLVDRWQIHHDGHLQPMVDNALDIGGASLRARNIYGASGVVNTSDRAAKQDFAPIDDALLDAWGGVSWRLYRFRDAVEAKGDGARIHAGAIAQDVHDVLAAQGLNPWRYGLLCRDDLTEPTGDPDGSVRVTGERWGLRYDQCLVVEAAYQRRRADLSDSRITALEQRVFA